MKKNHDSFKISNPFGIDLCALRECTPPLQGETEQEVRDYIEKEIRGNEEFLERNEKIYPDVYALVYGIHEEQMFFPKEYIVDDEEKNVFLP